MNQLSAWAIKNPIPIILLFLLLTLGGVTGFAGMRINNNPDIDFPLVAVTAARPGAAPTEMEVQVTRVIEDSIAGLSGVRHIYSNVSDGVSSTTIEFELGTDTERATNDVRNAMSGVPGHAGADGPAHRHHRRRPDHLCRALGNHDARADQLVHRQ